MSSLGRSSLSFVTPHPPWFAPPESYALYPHEQISMPHQWQAEDWPRHPAHEYMRRFFSSERPFPEATIRRLNAVYYAICTFLDQQIGRGARGAGRFEPSVIRRASSIHPITASTSARAASTANSPCMKKRPTSPSSWPGPDVPQGKVVDTPVSLIDCYPTILDAVGCEARDDGIDRPGSSLWDIAAAPEQDRTVFAEYHAIGSRNAYYMLRDRRYKYIYHVDAPAQLFDLIADPNELRDLALAPDAAASQLLTEYESQLRGILDPEAVDRRAKADQAARIETLGGREAVIARGVFTNSPAPGETTQIPPLSRGRRLKSTSCKGRLLSGFYAEKPGLASRYACLRGRATW